MKLSIVIKALNEERNIERCLRSAAAAAEAIDGGAEVVLADSLSTDQTVQIAQKFTIRIVQLVNPEDRCCGIGAEIGYRIAKGKFVYVLDADMEISREFLINAIAFLEQHSDVGGVGGSVTEMNQENAEFRGRAAKIVSQFSPGETDRLNMGGLYRREVIEKLGYLTNRRLHALEEYELGLRVKRLGYRLVRIPGEAVRHYGHTDSSFEMLRRRWRSRYIWGAGELLREAIEGGFLIAAFRGLGLFKLSAVLVAWWLLAAISTVMALVGELNSYALLLIWVLPVLFAIAKRRSIRDGLYLFCFLNYYAAGIFAGYFFRRSDEPAGSIDFVVLK